MTVVVPSPTSSSCVRLSSIMLLAAGWETSISRRMAWPSLVRTIPPMGSSSIFSMALGPRQERMMSATLRRGVRVGQLNVFLEGSSESLDHVRLGSSDVGHLRPAARLPLTTVGVWSVTSGQPCEVVEGSSGDDRVGRAQGKEGHFVLITSTGACMMGDLFGNYCLVVSFRLCASFRNKQLGEIDRNGTSWAKGGDHKARHPGDLLKSSICLWWFSAG